MPQLNSLICPQPQRLLAFLLLATVIFTIGCDDDPPKVDNTWWYSNSGCKPDPVERYGVKWVPAATSGEHNWVYYPEGVLSVIQTSRRFPPDTTVKILVAGSTWTLLRDASTCKVQAPWESDFSRLWTVGEEADLDVFTDYYWGIAAVSALVVVAICIMMLMYCRGQIIEEQQKRKAYEVGRAKELNDLETVLDQKQKKLEKWERAAAEQASKLDAWHKSEENNLQKLREGADEYIRRGMEMVRSAQEALKSRPNPKKISKYLREEHLQGAAFGETLVVNFLADQTGFILFKWEVLLKQNDAPTVIIYRDEKPIRTDAAFTGKHGDHIIPGHRHVYRFTVCDAKNRQFGKPLCIEFKTPAKKYWVVESGTDEKEHERNIREKFKSRFRGLELIQELKQSFAAKIKSKKYPEDIEGWLLDQLDGLAGGLGGEA